MHKKGISLFSVESFLAQNAEKLCKLSLLCFKSFLVWKKSLWIRDGGFHVFTFFRRNLFVSQYEKISWGNPWLFQKTSGIDKLFVWEGDITILRWLFFVSQCRKISQWNPSVLQKNHALKSLMHRRTGASWFSRNIFISQDRNTKLGRRTLLLSRKLLVAKNLMGKRRNKTKWKICWVK